MIQLFKSLNTKNRTLKDLRILAMFAISYTGFLRYNELSNIKANNMIFYEDYVNIFIVKNKTDCHRNGKNVVISKLDSLQCPLNILRCYLEEANVELNTDIYIFRALTYIKKVNKFVLGKKNVKLSYTRTREILKETLSSIGSKAVDFG